MKTVPFTITRFKTFVYNGVEPEVVLDSDEMTANLQFLLDHSRDNHLIGGWITIHPSLYMCAKSFGFELHHVSTAVAEAIVMSIWLDSTAPSRLPPPPTCTVGCGFLLTKIGDDGRIYGLYVNEHDIVRIPSGYVNNLIETPEDAAIREFGEELGAKVIVAEPLCIYFAKITMLEPDNVSNCYYLYHVKLKSESEVRWYIIIITVQVVKQDNVEIVGSDALRWLALEDVANDKYPNMINLQKELARAALSNLRDDEIHRWQSRTVESRQGRYVTMYS